MRIICPECQRRVSAENINMQRMAALCAHCSSLFAFELPRTRPKRRKVQKPEHLNASEDDTLRIAFRTNFRLDKNESFLNSAAMSAVFGVVSLLMGGLFLEGEVPLFLPLLFVMFSLAAFYALATITFNKTHLQFDGLKLNRSRQPLPSFTSGQEIALGAAEAFYAEESSASIEQQYDTARFHVWAELRDGSRRLAVADLPEEYAWYIASRLDACLARDPQTDAGRLSLEAEAEMMPETAESRLHEQSGA